MATPLRRTVVRVPPKPIRKQVVIGSGGMSFGAFFGTEGLHGGPRTVGTAARASAPGTFPRSPQGEVIRGS